MSAQGGVYLRGSLPADGNELLHLDACYKICENYHEIGKNPVLRYTYFI